MRNSDERYSWFDLEDALLQASRLAQDTGLERKRTILDKVIFRGQRMMSLCHNPSQVLVTWTQLFPNTRGVEQKQLLREVKALHRVRKANGLPAAALGGGSGASLSSAPRLNGHTWATPKEGGTQGRAFIPHLPAGRRCSRGRRSSSRCTGVKEKSGPMLGPASRGKATARPVRATPNLCRTKNWR